MLTLLHRSICAPDSRKLKFQIFDRKINSEKTLICCCRADLIYWHDEGVSHTEVVNLSNLITLNLELQSKDHQEFIYHIRPAMIGRCAEIQSIGRPKVIYLKVCLIGQVAKGLAFVGVENWGKQRSYEIKNVLIVDRSWSRTHPLLHKWNGSLVIGRIL